MRLIVKNPFKARNEESSLIRDACKAFSDRNESKGETDDGRSCMVKRLDWVFCQIGQKTQPHGYWIVTLRGV